jgi:hypothetical protein
MNDQDDIMMLEQPQRRVPCPRKIERRFVTNLQHAAHDRLNRERARLAQQLYDQLPRKQRAVARPKPAEQPAAGRPSPKAASTLEKSPPMAPRSEAGRWHRLRAAVQQGLKAAARRAWTFRLRGRTRQ